MCRFFVFLIFFSHFLDIDNDPCLENACLNGGTCVRTWDNSFFCSCRYGFSGQSCENGMCCAHAKYFTRLLSDRILI